MKPGKPQGRTLRAGIGWARGEHPIKGTPQTDKKIRLFANLLPRANKIEDGYFRARGEGVSAKVRAQGLSAGQIEKLSARRKKEYLALIVSDFN